MKLRYYFGEEDFDYYPNYRQIKEFLVPTLMVEEKKSKEEVEQLLENDEYFEEQCEVHYDEMVDYFEHDAECEYEATQESPDGFDDYDDFCRWRNPNL